MRESCEVRLEAGTNLGVVQQWRFVATIDQRGRRDIIEASEPFWSLSGLVFPMGSARTRVRDLLHKLALSGWHPWGTAEATGRGRKWYAHRLYRDTAS